MSCCTDYESLIEELLAEQIDGAGRDRLLSHSEGCAPCRSYVDLHYRLLGSELDVELPDERAFDSMRASVLDRVRQTASPRTRWAVFGLFGLRPAAAAGTVALLLLALTTGWFVGRTGTDQTQPALLGGMAAELHLQASGNHELSDVERSAYLFTNVQVAADEGDRLTLRFDVTRHMELTRAKDDDLVKEILVQSLLNDSPLGTRLEAISWAERQIDPKVKQALIVATLNDPNQAVRLKALDLLAADADDQDVRATLLEVLGAEESVQMRLRAIDHLAQSGISSERFRQALDDLNPTDDRALLVRAESYGRTAN